MVVDVSLVVRSDLVGETHIEKFLTTPSMTKIEELG
jgi:hypothetical protein